MSSDIESRIFALKSPFWIGYSRAQEIREQMDALLDHPRMHRMPNMAIIGESNNGKTMLLRNYYKRHKVDPDPEAAKVVLPVLMIQMPSEPDENRLYDEMLVTLFANQSPREPITSKLIRLKRLLAKLKTKQIIIDEFHNMLAGSLTRQRRLLNALKNFSNDLQIPLVAAGTYETLAALQADAQIANRFEPQFLPKWGFDKEFRRLLMTMEPKLGLKQESHLEEEKLAQLILAESEGTIGEVHSLLRKLAEHAMRTGEEKITVDTFKAETLRKANWYKPSIRNRRSS